MNIGHRAAGQAWLLFIAVFLVVLMVQLALVAAAGTDIPFHDQWDVEGRWLYPGWRGHSLGGADLLRLHNEHRIAWTHLLNVGLFTANGQWDPLVQMVAIAILRAGCAAGLAMQVGRTLTWKGQVGVGVVAMVAFLPHLAWHGVLWGFESQVYFAIAWGLVALASFSGETLSLGRAVCGLIAGIAALVAMGPAALVPVALLGLVGLRVIERRGFNRSLAILAGAAVGLLLLAALLRGEVEAHAELRARDVTQFIEVAGRVLAWPHVGAPIAAVAMNLPIVVLVLGRLVGRRKPWPGEDFIVLVAGWSVGIAFATAWARGGSGELARQVPSRYVDFVVLLPLANAWAVMALAREFSARRKATARIVAAAWALFVVVGWLGVSASAMRGIVLPRARDREAPVRLIQAYQVSGDPSVFAGQPRLLVPHPNLESVHAVLIDERLRGALPPSLQPDQPLGPLSRATRVLLGHPTPAGAEPVNR